MATVKIQKIPDLQWQSYQINKNASQEITFSGNAAVIFATRGSNAYVGFVDYWTSGSETVFSSTQDIITISKNANTHTLSLTNNTTLAIVVFVIAGKQ